MLKRQLRKFLKEMMEEQCVNIEKDDIEEILDKVHEEIVATFYWGIEEYGDPR